MSTIGKRLKKFRRSITYSDFFINMIANCAVLVITLYVKTIPVKFDLHADFELIDRRKTLYGFWHGRQFLLVPFFGSWKVSIMSDISWAGEIQTRILRRMGYTIIRGSSKRQSVRVLLQMKKSVEQGFPGAFALDGPSGPIHVSKPGIVFLARKLNIPITPVACSASNAWVLKNTWCRYTIPKPFSRCTVAVGKPVFIDDSFHSRDLDILLNQWQELNDRKCLEYSAHGN